MKALGAGDRLLLTLWVGGLWAIGYIVAPTLFASLDDRALAGQLAGKMFYIIALVGMVAAPLLLLRRAVSSGVAAALRQWQSWVLAAMLVLVAVGLLVLQPMMQDLKAQGLQGAEAAAAFGRLHGISSALYLLTSLGGLALVLAPGALREG